MAALEHLLGRTLVLVAHPDDEALGCGLLLQRMAQPSVLFFTDGAPRDPHFWRGHGSRQAYASVRRAEADEAMARAGVSRFHFTAPEQGDHPFVDQELFRALPLALWPALEFARTFRPDALLTLAYEGGHPDHDCCSFITSVLSESLSLPAWEMPLYHLRPDASHGRQQFLEPSGSEIFFEGTPAEIARKHQVLAAYASQAGVLADFAVERECLRPLPAYDYSRPPHGGPLNYEAWGWPVSGQEVCASFAACLANHRETANRL